MAKKPERVARRSSVAGNRPPKSAPPETITRTRAYVAATDVRVTTNDSWKALTQVRHELLTNPRQDAGWWRQQIGRVDEQLWLGGFDRDTSRYAVDSHRVCLSEAKRTYRGLGGKWTWLTVDDGDDNRDVLFRPGAHYWCTWTTFIDWAKPFPPIAERGPIVEWLEAWLDRLAFIFIVGRLPGDDDEPNPADKLAPAPKVSPTPAADTVPRTDHHAPTMGELASEVGISDDTFRRVRKAAGIREESKGAAARNRRYTPREVDRLIDAARAGTFLERAKMIEKWAKWGSK